LGYIATKIANTESNTLAVLASSDAAKIGGCKPCWAAGDAANSARYKTCTITTSSSNSVWTNTL